MFGRFDRLVDGVGTGVFVFLLASVSFSVDKKFHQWLTGVLSLSYLSFDHSSSGVVFDGAGRVADADDAVGRQPGDLDAAAAHQAPGMAVQAWRGPRTEALPVDDDDKGPLNTALILKTH